MTDRKRPATGTTSPSAPPPSAQDAGARAPARADEPREPLAPRSTSADVAEFLSRMRQLAPRTGSGRGRLVFAMDATMSRQPTWDMALALQGEMFEAVRQVGTLDVQLVFFRGSGECRASRWVSDPSALARLMTGVECRGGHTQIGKVLAHARSTCETRKIDALVYVGDCMEESVDELCHRAGELALLGVPVFLFQEGRDPRAETAFREIARLTKGAWCAFGPGSAEELRALLTAVAVYAAGGRKALEALALAGQSKGARRLIEQMKPGGR